MTNNIVTFKNTRERCRNNPLWSEFKKTMRTISMAHNLNNTLTYKKTVDMHDGLEIYWYFAIRSSKETSGTSIRAFKFIRGVIDSKGFSKREKLLLDVMTKKWDSRLLALGYNEETDTIKYDTPEISTEETVEEVTCESIILDKSISLRLLNLKVLLRTIEEGKVSIEDKHHTKLTFRLLTKLEAMCYKELYLITNNKN